MTFSSIDAGEMHQLGYGVQNAGKGLTECAAQLRAILNEVGLTHPGAAAIGRIGQWLTDQAPDLYRRRDLAYEAEKVDVDVFGNPMPGALVPPGLTRIDESRMIPAKVRAEAAQAAPLFAAAARGDAGALHKLAAYKERLSDPAFATALLEQIGPQALLTIPAAMGTRVRKALDADRDTAEPIRRQNRDVLSMLSTALAAATDATKDTHLGRRFMKELKRQGRTEIPAPDMGGLTNAGYWSLGQILAAAPKQAYSEWFMKTIGQDMIRWDRDYLKEHRERFLPKDTDVYNLPAPIDTRPFQGSDAIGAADPIAALMTIAGTSRERAQALLDSRDLLKYLLSDRRPQWEMGDRGESLGAAMEAAMKGADADSKRLAVTAGQILADVVKPHVSFNDAGELEIKDPSELDRLSGIRDNMGRILAEHTDDIVSSYYKNYARAKDGELTGIVNGRPIAEFSPPDIDLVLLDVAADEKGYQALLFGQIAHMRGRIDQAIAAHDNTFLQNVITNDSKALGHLLEARKLALVGRGKEADAADSAFKKMVENGIGLVPVPFAGQVGKVGLKVADTIYENFVKDGYAKAGNWLVEKAGHAGGKTAKGFGTAASDQKAAEQMVKQMLESSSVAHDYYDRDGLKEQPFVEGDPPRVKAPHRMTRYEYDNFVSWLDRHSRVPDDFGSAQTKANVGANEFTADIGGPGTKAGEDD
ncbi:hypothetical protein FH608_000530 [Nonomuraea phyllanthi]|uniref:DUF6571 domain-containing protein n=1 Tax=Nonomuraea phyllanthi TaxID=2219224 RepID=A0A5C4WWW0_9ACTN|nr:DUF6571 family protein [Nonomuraea phyllanthi]KAB8197098.1 hypothetical protein FH608_000530 [Nonomuraea phyllanthi]